MKNNLTTFYLVRHGETDWNKKRILQGQTDIQLNETGEEQAKKVAQQFKNIEFDLVFSSDLLRAKRTAEIIALEHKLAVQATKKLRERKFGSLEGKPSNILLTYEKLLRALTIEERKKMRIAPEAENDDEFAARIITFLRETAITYPNKNILAATHSGVLRILIIHLGFMTYEKFDTMRFINGGYLKLESDGVEFFIKEMHGLVSRKDEQITV
ncbi:MAG TPA: histidine phosphatase family protein [Candidatus Sulfotelmatobacter sp.]|jgi:broad specificity phosphatase PhoE|nr:histidine phosphatase family protein [Candidatus Sulfotelmatobacter sp.]